MSLLRLEGVIAGYGGGDVLQGVDMTLSLIHISEPTRPY